MSLLDIIHAVMGSAQSQDYKGALSSAISILQADLSKLAGTQGTIADVMSRAKAYLNSSDSDVVNAAQSVISEAQPLLDNLTSIPNDTEFDLASAQGLVTTMQTDPLWRQMLGEDTGVPADWNSIGSEVKKQFQYMINTASDMTNTISIDASKIDDHMGRVTQLQADMKGLDDLAQGRGVTGALHSVKTVIGNAVSSVESAGSKALTAVESGASNVARAAAAPLTNSLYIAVGIGMVILLWPQLVSGTLTGVRKGLKRNPRRRSYVRY